MSKFRLNIKTYYGEISIEGDSLQDFRHSLEEMGISSTLVDSIINAAIVTIERKDATIIIPAPITPSKPEQSGIIEYLSDGTPHISVSTDKLSAREVIGLLLYAKSPTAMSLNELTQLVSNNWKTTDIYNVSANLSQMRAYVIKEGARRSYSYKLSGAGKNWIETELLPKLKPRT